VADVFEYLPWTVAERLFRPDKESSYPGILQGISTARSILGFLLVAFFSLVNGVWPFNEFSYVRTATIAAFAAAAWVCLLLLVRRRPMSDSFKAGSRKVLRRVLALFVSAAIGSVVLRIPVLGTFAAFWLFFFVWWSFWLVCKYQFGAGDAAAMLAPLVTTTTAAILAAYNLAAIHTSKIPPRLDELIVLCGVGTTALLSIAELLVLRHHGERLFTESAVGPALGWAGSSLPGGHVSGGPASRPYPWAGQPVRSHRRHSRPPVMRIIVIGGALAGLLIAGLVLQEATKGGSGEAAPSQQSGAPPLGSLTNPAQGRLTVRPNHDYLLAVGSPYPIARVGGADVGHLTGTAGGLEVAEAYALPLPRDVSGGYQSCLALDWTGTRVWGVGHIIPWAALQPGRQLCVQTTYSGLYISLLTVRLQAGHRVVFRVATWACNARPGESAIC